MKRNIYILTTIFLGLLLSFIAHGLAEIALIKYLLGNGQEIQPTYFLGVGWCALPVWAQYSFLVLGVVGGFFLGRYWWDVVYVQKRHWRMRKKQK